MAAEIGGPCSPKDKEKSVHSWSPVEKWGSTTSIDSDIVGTATCNYSSSVTFVVRTKNVHTLFTFGKEKCKVVFLVEGSSGAEGTDDVMAANVSEWVGVIPDDGVFVAFVSYSIKVDSVVAGSLGGADSVKKWEVSS